MKYTPPMRLPMRLPRQWWIPALAGGGVAAAGIAIMSIRSARQKAVLNGGPGALPPAGAPPAPGPVVPRVHTGGGDYYGDRFAALAARGIAGQQARAVLGLWAYETAAGKGEWNFNVGNYTAPKGVATYFVVPSSCASCGGGCPCWWVAYDTLDAGASDWIARVSRSWPNAWSLLQSSPTTTDWVAAMSGYYGGASKVASYVAGYSSALAKVPMPSA